MTRRYIGYGVTNNKGIAKLEYDSEGNALTHSYTGAGAGKLNIVAEYETSDTPLTTEEYTITDCVALDRGTRTNNTLLFTSGTILDRLSRGDEDTTLLYNKTTSGASSESTGSYTLNGGLAFEITITNYVLLDINSIRMNLTGGTNSGRTISLTGPCQVRFECRPTSTKAYIDDELIQEWEENNITSAIFQFRYKGQSENQVSYKDFMIYPI